VPQLSFKNHGGEAKVTDKKYCDNAECKTVRTKAQIKQRKSKYGICKVEGCSKPAERANGLCEPCFYRIRRKGTTAYYKAKDGYIHSLGYVVLKENHPLKGSNGYVYEHRKVMYDAVGPGEHNCHWCGALLKWDDIIIDHLNGDKGDNRLDNLRISCYPCKAERRAALAFIKRVSAEAFGEWIEQIIQYRGKLTAGKK
jgi:hypothetical protein